MSERPQHVFLPWVRQGAARLIETVEDVSQDLPDEATFDVSIRVNAEPSHVVKVGLYGPGWVTGLEDDQVIRTDPRPNAQDFEPNYFALLEFDRPDIPWLVTPARARGDVLRPWICLVVVPRGPGRLTRGHGRAVLTVDDPDAQLPDLSESWAWAHVQISGGLRPGETVDSVLSGATERTLSRLICPRRLEPDTAYIACVVPTTEAGRLAGLGLPLPAPAVPPVPLGPAWRPGAAGPIDLPAFHPWEFATGADGDFESLARLIRARPAPEDAGKQPMDVLPIVPGAPRFVLGFEGALRSPTTESDPWPQPVRDQFQIAITTLLDAPATLAAADPSIPGVVAPPIYGSFHAAVRTVPASRPVWLRQLNLDPRPRGAAGLGTRVVQEEQEQLMAAAWEQVGEVERANQVLRQAQLARAAGIVLHEQHFATFTAGALLQVTQPGHSRTLMSPDTLSRRVRVSSLPTSLVTPAFRRITRPAGPLVKRAAPGAAPVVRPFVRRVSRREIAGVSAPRPPGGTSLLDDVADSLLPTRLPPWLRSLLPYAGLLLAALALLLLAAALLLLWLAGLAAGIVALALAAAVLALAAVAAARRPRWTAGVTMRTEGLTPSAVERAPGRPDFAPIPAAESAPPQPSSARGSDSEAASRFRAAATTMQGRLTTLRFAGRTDPPPVLNVGQVETQLLARIDPRVTVPPAVLTRVDLPADWAPEDPIEPIMAAPEFSTPMYEPLGRLAKELFFPGVDEIEPNSAMLLETNTAFIEAYMVGLNHELGRELLWRSYPTDQRGTYFRQFWDVRGRIPPPADDAERERLKDITLIHTWPRSSRLGDVASGGKPEGTLVLLLTAQLLARYPNTVIYASKADSRPESPGRAPLEPPDNEERYPIFAGKLPPNITFLGFDLRLEEARGGPAPTGDDPDPGPGWFFVLQQQPTEPRFGLDEEAAAGGPTTFAGLAWGDMSLPHEHIGVAQTALDPAVSALRGPQGQAWGGHAGNLAYATLQRPFRVAISADDMLGPA